jgi:hypothetical protein
LQLYSLHRGNFGKAFFSELGEINGTKGSEAKDSRQSKCPSNKQARGLRASIFVRREIRKGRGPGSHNCRGGQGDLRVPRKTNTGKKQFPGEVPDNLDSNLSKSGKNSTF